MKPLQRVQLQQHIEDEQKLVANGPCKSHHRARAVPWGKLLKAPSLWLVDVTPFYLKMLTVTVML